MIYECNLQTKYFMEICKGSKRFEMRIYRDKWTKINTGDILKISNIGYIIYCLVEEAIQCSSFRDALEAFDIDQMLPYGNYVEDGLIIYNKIYNDSIDKKFGVIVFKLKVILD